MKSLWKELRSKGKTISIVLQFLNQLRRWIQASRPRPKPNEIMCSTSTSRNNAKEVIQLINNPKVQVKEQKAAQEK